MAGSSVDGALLARYCERRLILNEVKAARWLTREELGSVAWLPADETIIGEVGERLRRFKINGSR